MNGTVLTVNQDIYQSDKIKMFIMMVLSTVTFLSRAGFFYLKIMSGYPGYQRMIIAQIGMLRFERVLPLQISGEGNGPVFFLCRIVFSNFGAAGIFFSGRTLA